MNELRCYNYLKSFSGLKLSNAVKQSIGKFEVSRDSRTVEFEKSSMRFQSQFSSSAKKKKLNEAKVAKSLGTFMAKSYSFWSKIGNFNQTQPLQTLK